MIKIKGVVSKETAVIRSDEGLTLETSAFRIPVRWSIYIINSVDKNKIFCILRYGLNGDVRPARPGMVVFCLGRGIDFITFCLKQGIAI